MLGSAVGDYVKAIYKLSRKSDRVTWKMNNRNRHLILASLLVVASIVLVSGFPGGHDEPKRTIVVTAQNMMFNETNPTIVLPAGETVRLVFRNEDPGMKHDLNIPVLGIRTGVLETGEEAVLEFRVPKRGNFEYLCSLHPVSMRGMFAVNSAGDEGVVAETMVPESPSVEN